MGKGVGLRGRLALAGLALGCVTTAPAEAQFMSGGYPVILVPPPPAQSLVMPRKRTPPPPPAAQAPIPPGPAEPRQLTCHYQGQTRICE